MSASNWAICPRCRDNAKAEVAAAIQAAVDAYGKVPADEYEELQRHIGVLSARSVQATFREDYEFYGAEDGEVVADYSGHCQTCGLGVDFTHKREFYKAGS